ncbi:hypothetical protein LTR94_037928, partial [Friedmanniomyces endolithicus]
AGRGGGGDRASAGRRLRRHPGPGHDRRKELRPAHRRQAGRRPDLGHRRGRVARHLRAPDLRRQRPGDDPVVGRQEGDH